MSDRFFINLEGCALSVGNALFEQQWLLVDGTVRLNFFALKGCVPWVDDRKQAVGAISDSEPVAVGNTGIIAFEVDEIQHRPNEALSLCAHVTLQKTCGAQVSYLFQVFESVAGCIVHRLEAADTGQIAEADTSARNDSVCGFKCDGIEQDPLVAVESTEPLAPGSLSSFLTARGHPEVTFVSFMEQTDHHGELVYERSLQIHPSEAPLRSKDNLFLLNDPATGDGLGLLLLAPSSLVRGQWGSNAGYHVEAARSNQLGCTARIQATLEHYPLVVFAWRNGRAGVTAALHALQSALHQWRSGVDGLFLSNTWGDRGRGERINEQFVLDEIALGKRLGTDVVQVDDGWQTGQTANTKAGYAGAWNGFWADSPDFWEPSKAAFPAGLSNVVKATSAGGMQFGLWYAPDSSNDFANWQKDAGVLLGFWQTYGIRHFKLDAIKITSLKGEHNLGLLLEAVQDGSGGAILLDMDLTAEYRLTYWGNVSGSTLFLQNRYTDWGNYYPHQTLRALWSLSAYVLPSRLRLEVLNPERNQDVYGSDPLRPASYPPEYLLAITLPASGLGWFEHTGLGNRTLEAWAQLLAVWKQHRERWHAGRISRIGMAPNGFSWTGFVSASEGGLYLLVFRERNLQTEHVFTLPQVEDAVALRSAQTAPAAEVLAGTGTAQLTAVGELLVTIPQMQHFLLARIG